MIIKQKHEGLLSSRSVKLLLKLIEVKKQFVGRKPNTQYSVTKTGKEAFKDHLSALESLLN